MTSTRQNCENNYNQQCFLDLSIETVAMETISIPELIMKKRDAKELNEAEVHAFVKSVASGSANSAQAGESMQHNVILT